MLRLIIADDEKHIVELIDKLLDYERHGLQLAGTAANGLEALALVEQQRPDVLITDIKMPGMDGLLLIKAIRERSIPVHIIVVSGHKEFDYAYGALKYGVDDFVIKPINRGELNEAVGKIKTQLRGPAEKSAAPGFSAASVKGSMEALHAQLMRDALVARGFPPALEEINRVYGVQFIEGGFLGICVRLVVPGIEKETSSITSKIKKAIEESYEGCMHRLILIRQGNLWYILLNMEKDNDDRILRRTKKLYVSIVLELDIYKDAGVTIGLGQTTGSPAGIPASLADAGLCSRMGMIIPGTGIFAASQLNMNENGPGITGTLTNGLRVLLETGHVNELPGWMQTVFCLPEEEYHQRPAYALSLLDAVFNVFFSLCRLLDVQTEQQREVLQQELECARGFENTRAALLGMMQNILHTDYTQRLQRVSYPVSSAKEFITQHLSEVLRLEDIALHVQLSASYLSMLFKKETGENVSDYIQYVRLEEAKRLLRTTNLYVNEIAQQVGYADPKHFSKLFRKQTGSRPQDYRRLYSW